MGKIAFTLRTPSPGLPLSAELSTIIEADNSGVSKYITANSSPTTTANRNTTSTQERNAEAHSHECDVDASAMDLSTTHLENLVRDAIRDGDSLKGQWLNADKAVVIIDGEEHPDMADTTFNMGSVDRDLADLLCPHSAAKQVPSSVLTSNPIPPNFSTSPASRLPRARQTSSFLPRFRSSNPPSTPIHRTHTPPPKPSPSIANGHNALKSSSSPALPSTSTSTPISSRKNTTLNDSLRLISPSSSSSRAAKMFGKQQPRSATPTRTLRQVMLGVRNIESPRPTSAALGWSSLDSRRCASATENGAFGLGRPMSRGASLDSRTRPTFNRSSTSPERTIETTPTEAESSPSPDIPFQEYRPSIDSNTTTRPSFDGIIISRPNSAAPLFRDRDRDGQQTLRVVDPTTTRASPIPRIPTSPPTPTTRMRRRSMSVQDSKFVGRNRGVTTATANEDLLVRSGSSLSIYGNKTTMTSRGGTGGGVENGSNTNESNTANSGPKMEWLGPRTAKAFRAAGLMDFDHREKERDSREEGNSESTAERLLRDRSSSTSGGVLSPSPLGVGNPGSTLNRFASLRSASEYNPIYGRSHSRLTLSSETGSGAPRRGSESFYTYGGASSHSSGGGGGGGGGSSYNGLMESPTFTVSSGSRDRDTPKSSISTGPTSLADSFGYPGRDRERDREREAEMMREMKEKHGTEMGALLGALSDSQRAVRVLREENSDLRDSLERFTAAIQTNQELRRVCEGLQSECGSLRKENIDLRKELVGLRGLARGGGNSSGIRTPVPKTAMNSSSPLGRTFTSGVALEEEYDKTFIDHGSEVENHGSSSADINILASPSSKKRRLSNSSSIFPIPAPNMTLLLHEDTSTLGSFASGNRSSTGTDHSQYGFSLPPPSTAAVSSQRIKTHVRSLSQSPPVSYHNFTGNIPPNSSVISVGSISPSMVTGSPGSLFLRPEHEILLGDMESLDLGVRGDDGDIVDDNVDGW